MNSSDEIERLREIVALSPGALSKLQLESLSAACEALEAAAPPKILERGQNYAALGMVAAAELSSDAENIFMVESRVAGSADEPYLARLWLVPQAADEAACDEGFVPVLSRSSPESTLPDGSRPMFHCSCPFAEENGIVCKHMVALGLVAGRAAAAMAKEAEILADLEEASARLPAKRRGMSL